MTSRCARASSYTTVLVDMTPPAGRPAADREADTLADWLGAHPGVEFICRDRAAPTPKLRNCI